MKLEAARELGKECGLQEDAEFVNNILLHGVNLFKYEDINKEFKELIDDAKQHGIKFCDDCGAAMIDDKCYMCEKFVHTLE